MGRVVCCVSENRRQRQSLFASARECGSPRASGAACGLIGGLRWNSVGTIAFLDRQTCRRLRREASARGTSGPPLVRRCSDASLPRHAAHGSTADVGGVRIAAVRPVRCSSAACLCIQSTTFWMAGERRRAEWPRGVHDRQPTHGSPRQYAGAPLLPPTASRDDIFAWRVAHLDPSQVPVESARVPRMASGQTHVPPPPAGPWLLAFDPLSMHMPGTGQWH